MLLESRADANSSGTSLVNILDVSDPASLVQVQNFTFTLDGPGTVPDRQEAPHPHQTVLDPTGAFLLVPDLGADLVRIFATSADGTVEMLDPLPVEPGSGPRHIAFAERDGTIMYLISELSNTISAWKVSYSEGTIEFEEMFIISTHGGCRKVPEGASASEILVSVSTSPSSNLALSGVLVGGKRLIHLPSLPLPSPTANSSPSRRATSPPTRSPTPPPPTRTTFPPTPSSPSPSARRASSPSCRRRPRVAWAPATSPSARRATSWPSGCRATSALWSCGAT